MLFQQVFRLGFEVSIETTSQLFYHYYEWNPYLRSCKRGRGFERVGDAEPYKNEGCSNPADISSTPYGVLIAQPLNLIENLQSARIVRENAITTVAHVLQLHFQLRQL